MTLSQREREWRAKHIMIDVSGHWKPLVDPQERYSEEDRKKMRDGLAAARRRTEGLVTAWLWRAHATRGAEMDLRILAESAYLQGYVDCFSGEAEAPVESSSRSASSPEGSTPPTPDASEGEPR